MGCFTRKGFSMTALPNCPISAKGGFPWLLSLPTTVYGGGWLGVAESEGGDSFTPPLFLPPAPSQGGTLALSPALGEGHRGWVPLITTP